MRRVDFADFIKPLLRASGLTLITFVLLFCWFNFTPIAKFAVPINALQLIEQLLSISPILVMGVLFVLLSLADRHRIPPRAADRPSVDWQDRILMRCRFLVALLALLYLLTIPYSVVQAQLLRNIGVRLFDRRSMPVLEKLSTAKSALSRPGLDAAGFTAIKKKYAAELGSDAETLASPLILRKYVERRIRDERAKNSSFSKDADRSLNKRMTGIVISYLLHAAIFGYFWFYWPHQNLTRWSKAPDLTDIGLEMEESRIP